MKPEDLTPDQKDEVQEYFVRRWLRAKQRPRGTRRRTDRAVVVARFDVTGQPVGTIRSVPPPVGDGRQAHCQRLGDARRKSA